MVTGKTDFTYKTLTPKDPEYLDYMLGNFSDHQRAIPQSTLNRQSLHEIITFELRDIADLEPASLWKKWSLLIKPQLWLTVLVPLIVISNLQGGTISWFTLILAAILILLMIFANWRADLADHLEGWDRLQAGQVKSVLQMGWYTGRQIQIWSRNVLLMGMILAIPLVLKYPWVLVPYALAVLSLLLLLPRWWRKSIVPGLSSFLIFLLAGPLLTVGIDLAFDAVFVWNALWVGFAWGLWMAFIRQQRIYTMQWYFHKRPSQYFFLGLGFDRSKALMRLLIPLVPILMTFTTIFLSGGGAWFFPMLVVHSVFVIWELQLNEAIQSTVGSSLISLQKAFRWHYYAISAVMVIGSIIWKSAL